MKIVVFLKVHSIKTFKHKLDKFILMLIYFLRIDKYKQPVYACIYYKIHLIDSLKANMLVKNDIIMLEGIIINLANFIIFISSCNI